MGKLWENLLVIERMKLNSYGNIDANYYFWRTYDRQEIDLIEESPGRLSAFDFKYSAKKKAAVPRLWQKTYPNSHVDIVTTENAMAFLS